MDLIHDISDLYTLYKNKKFCHTAGFGKKRWSNILKSIDESREMYSDEFLGSLGIEGLSRKTARKILSVIPYYTIIDNMVDGNTTALYNMLICIEGIGSIMAENIIHGLKENLDLIEHFESLVSLGEFRIVDVQVQSYEPKFTVCFSRIRDNDTEKTIEAKEGLVVDNVNKDTTYLVVPSEAVHSSKITKARKHGVRIVTLDEFKEILMNM
jgi:NAD-dependent DNA ligase